MILFGDRILHISEAVRDMVEHYFIANHSAPMPVSVTEDSDGHTVKIQPQVKKVIMKHDGTWENVDIAALHDIPINFHGGGSMVTTYGVKKNTDGLFHPNVLNEQRHLEKGGVQTIADYQKNSFLSGSFSPVPFRTDPKKLKHVDNDAIHHRSHDKAHVNEVHPDTGHHSKSVDPSDPSLTDGSDPFKTAKKFFNSKVHPTGGHEMNATDNGTTHSITNSHGGGPSMAANNGAHTVNAHPSGGVKINSPSGLMKIGGQIESTIAGFKFPDGSIQKSAAMAIATFSGGSSSAGGGGGTSFPTLDSQTPPSVLGHQAVNGPAFAAHATVATSVPSAVATLVLMDMIEFDTDRCYNHTTGVFTPNVAGYYEFKGAAGFAAAQPKMTLSIFKNNVELRRGSQGAVDGDHCVVSGFMFMDGATDHVDIRLYHEAGSSQSSVVGIPVAYFEGVMVRGQ
jgi:hypothetical protein